MTEQMRTGAGEIDRELSWRVRGEYLEMPGLQLTIPQACRLWNVSPTTGRDLLDSLVAEAFLRQTAGYYVRADSGRLCA